MKKLLFFVFAAVILAACNNGTGPVALESASLSKSTLELTEGSTYRLTVKPSPAEAVVESVTWSSSDEMIASVSENGTVSANTVGTATITAKVDGTDIVATCQVTVKSILEATVFDQLFIWKSNSDAPYDITMRFQGEDGEYKDTVCRAITATFALFPSTMYLDGEGYMSGDGGYVMFFESAFTIDEATNAWYCLSDYVVVDSALNSEGKFKPWAIQASNFDAENYAAYWTQYILFANDQAEKPNADDYPYYDDNDAFFYRAFAAEDEGGVNLLDGGYLVLNEGADCFISAREVSTVDDRALDPLVYNLDVKLFDNVNNLGFAIEERVDETSGETKYVFVDKNEDNLFDLAEMIDYNFSKGSLSAGAPAATPFNNVKSIPANVALKNIAINRTLHAAFLVNAKIK